MALAACRRPVHHTSTPTARQAAVPAPLARNLTSQFRHSDKSSQAPDTTGHSSGREPAERVQTDANTNAQEDKQEESRVIQLLLGLQSNVHDQFSSLRVDLSESLARISSRIDSGKAVGYTKGTLNANLSQFMEQMDSTLEMIPAKGSRPDSLGRSKMESMLVDCQVRIIVTTCDIML